ncbi:sulfotransferase family 2 domain-containing protein [Falsiroseomonas sp. CW058]|uniref:sulfotransferase family 2 domain-containing protein n=1 Tax=Falsiroseomonas sp. CW058 TaxID=3388664 RepID=UPI003D310D36
MAIHVFLHVPKTAGSSLRTVLSRQYGARHVLYYDLPAGDRRPLPEIEAELRQRLGKRQARLITGHQFLGIHQVLRVPCTYFTMLRDPIDRVLSEYFYAFTYPHHRLGEAITSGRLSPMEFLASPRHAQPAAQAAQLAGRATRPVVEAAIANIDHAIAAVGIAEEFERSLLLIARRLGWAPPLFVARNVTRLDPAQAEARAAARREAEAHRPLYAPDAAVHAAARRRFEADIAAEGPAFEAAFAAFSALQAQLAARAGDQVYDRYEFRTDDELPPFAAELRQSDEYRAVEAFLAAPRPPDRRILNCAGAIESLEDGVLRGWALDLADPAPVTVRLLSGGEVLAATRAQLRRPPEADGPGGFSGFRLPLPPGRKDLRLVFGETAIAVPDPARLLP